MFGLLHLPEGAVQPLAFVMSHPFGEEKLWSHRVFVSCARALAARGHAVLRFDYFGAGDSNGMSADASLGTHCEDLRAALGALEQRVPAIQQIGLIGLRLGASFAALLAESNAQQQLSARLRGAPLVLWDPILDGDAYFQELLRSNLSTQLAVYGKVVDNREVLTARIRAGGSVNVDGYEIGKDLLDSCGVSTLLGTEPKQHAGPTLVVQIAATEAQKERADLKALASSYSQGTALRAAEQPFWREIKPFYPRASQLQELTLRWLDEVLSTASATALETAAAG
ncbi:serine aminopeptidase domain-containing protein [Steroidobacter cummioxidans]|uniref:serine aminopeptidase domain-containing protein n=1 Tax=Steroidobacter cummioxidans TaxID=1803913 RepID=UPI000E3117EC|nr:alpha/beta hydrolase [Steroidobacter cummioxidans]